MVIVLHPWIPFPRNVNAVVPEDQRARGLRRTGGDLPEGTGPCKDKSGLLLDACI